MRLSATASSAFAAARLALVLLLMGVATACSADNRAVFHTSKGDFPFSIEVADTEASRKWVGELSGYLDRVEIISD